LVLAGAVKEGTFGWLEPISATGTVLETGSGDLKEKSILKELSVGLFSSSAGAGVKF
jgi:hypothetical protein